MGVVEEMTLMMNESECFEKGRWDWMFWKKGEVEGLETTDTQAKKVYVGISVNVSFF